MDLSQIVRLRLEQDKAVKDTEGKITQWEKFKSDYEALQKRLKTLPDKVTHDVMVPFGPLAMMPGQLIHTNEITVLLGDNWFVERSAKQASEIVARRVKAIDSNLEELYEEKNLLTPRQKFTRELENMAMGSSEMSEINEAYDSDTEKKWKEQHTQNVRKYKDSLKQEKGTDEKSQEKASLIDDALWARLDELEKQEEERDEIDGSDDDKDEDEPQDSTVEKENQQRVSWADEVTDDATDDSDMESDTESDVSECGTSASDYDTDTEEEVARQQMCRITFTHTTDDKTSKTSSSGSNSEGGAEAAAPLVQSPGDIYKHFLKTTQPKSILKQKKTRHKAETRQISFKDRARPPRSVPVKSVEKPQDAFTGTVVEKVTANQNPASTTSSSAPPPTSRPVSRFRARRQQSGGAAM